MPSDLPCLVLASASPRRIELLRSLGLDPLVRPADIDESALEAESPDAYVVRLAREKARNEAHQGELVLAADTIVVLDDEMLGKPTDRDDAREMLGKLSGRTHQVLTGIALLEPSRQRDADHVVLTKVQLAAMTDEQIDWYIETGEPMDKAGAYAIQGQGALFVHSIEGNYTNVVGLPLPSLNQLFRRLDYDLRDFESS